MFSIFNNYSRAYLIAGSGPLAMRDIRAAVDIDILENEALWDSLQAHHEVSGDCHNRIEIGRLEMWKDWMNLTYRMNEMIVGFPFMRLVDTIAWKKYLGRPKDLEDIIAINKYEKNSAIGESPDARFELATN